MFLPLIRRLPFLFAAVAALLLAPGPARADFLPPSAPKDIDPIVQKVLDCWSYGHKLTASSSTAGVAGQGLVCLHGEGKATAIGSLQRMIVANNPDTLVVWQRAAGDLPAGVSLTQTILDHHLTVIVDGPCVGPCLWWFLAGRQRLLTPDARLDFASMPPMPPILADHVRQATGLDPERLRAAGGPVRLPTADELTDLGVAATYTPVILQPKADD